MATEMELENREEDYSDVAVVIPAYNEARVIRGVVENVLHQFPRIQAVVVDDGSTDNTSSCLNDLPIHLLYHSVNLGQGAAIQTGLSYGLRCNVDYFVTYDADGQHRVSDMKRMICEARNGSHDFLLGSRFINAEGAQSIPRSRRILLHLATHFTRLTTGLSLTDTHNGLRCMSKAGAHSINLTMNGMAHASEILEQIGRSGLPWKEVSVTVDYTEYSRLKGQKASNMINILWDLFFRI